jgi:hypothetical protein
MRSPESSSTTSAQGRCGPPAGGATGVPPCRTYRPSRRVDTLPRRRPGSGGAAPSRGRVAASGVDEPSRARRTRGGER